MANLRGWQLVILVLLIVLLFGSKKLPDAARSLGRSLRIFKAETKALVDEDEDKAENEQITAGSDGDTVDAELVDDAHVDEQSSQQSGSTKNS
jgi:sec-independent protein translocase protein TatA